MNGNICRKSILKTASIAIFAVLFYTVCDDNGVKVVTPEVTTFVDYRDNKTYKKVQIGEQIWMAENLKYEADGSKCYDNDWADRDPAIFCEEYGRLYDWNTAMDGEHSSTAIPSGVEGVCPAGWHLPSDAEWQVLIDYVGINAGTKLKSRTFKGNSELQRPDGTDKYRFSALDGPWASRWWSATELVSDEEMAWFGYVTDMSVEAGRSYINKHENFSSVRCVHD
jgi:uncharacterized protein (TIGR02145 family)